MNHRFKTTAFAAILAFAAIVVAGTATAADSTAPLFEQPPAGTADFTGKWLNAKPAVHLLATDGREPPLNAAGKAEYSKRQATLRSDDHRSDPVSSCLMHGVPRLLSTAYPFLILQTTRSVNFVHEANHTFRIVYWEKPPGDEPDPSYLGASTAHLDGRTLVIDSVAFNDLTWLDSSGLPHGEKLQVQERYTLDGPSTLQGLIRITDPDFYSAPWTTRLSFRRLPGMELQENVCMDTHRM